VRNCHGAEQQRAAGRCVQDSNLGYLIQRDVSNPLNLSNLQDSLRARVTRC
jgi:hypothetical protein